MDTKRVLSREAPERENRSGRPGAQWRRSVVSTRRSVRGRADGDGRALVLRIGRRECSAGGRPSSTNKEPGRRVLGAPLPGYSRSPSSPALTDSVVGPVPDGRSRNRKPEPVYQPAPIFGEGVKELTHQVPKAHARFSKHGPCGILGPSWGHSIHERCCYTAARESPCFANSLRRKIFRDGDPRNLSTAQGLSIHPTDALQPQCIC